MLLAEILVATSAIRPRVDVAYCLHALVRRLAKTHNWTVWIVMPLHVFADFCICSSFVDLAVSILWLPLRVNICFHLVIEGNGGLVYQIILNLVYVDLLILNLISWKCATSRKC